MSIKLKFIAPPEPKVVYTANIHSTGRLGFAIDTAKAFKIEVGKSMQLAVNDNDKADTNVYGVLLDTVDEKNAYKVSKGGDYHSVNAKAFFDLIGVNYSEGGVSYEVTEEVIDGMRVLKFSKRERKNKKKPYQL